MIRNIFAVILSLAVVCPAIADELRVLPDEIEGVKPTEMMHTYLMDRVYAALEKRTADYEKVKTAEDVVAYQKRMREFFLEKLGGFPERSPLNARVVARRDFGDYRMEKVIFESRPRLYVTALLYLPKSKPPYPGVLFPCGHSGNGKASEAYQRTPILFAKNGMAALCYDPIDQGERYQLLNAEGKPIIDNCVVGHCLTGVGCVLLGRNTASFRIWDGMRAIDYLQSRPEVDPKRIGCAGQSGGGTLCSYLMALDERIGPAAPACYLTNFRRLLEKSGPQDAEQNIHGQIAFGMDHADYVMIRAPKPTLMVTCTLDGFDIGGSWESFREAKRLYSRLGLAERVDLIESDARHSLQQPSREAMARWMLRWMLRIDEPVTESESSVLTEEEVWCAPRGQVMLLERARNAYDFNIELDKQLALRRRELWRSADKRKY